MAKCVKNTDNKPIFCNIKIFLVSLTSSLLPYWPGHEELNKS